MEKTEGTIQSTIGPGHWAYLSLWMTGADLISKLKEVYRTKGFTAREIIWRKVTRMTLSDYPSVALYGESIKKARSQLEAMGYSLPNWVFTTSVFHGLGEGYQGFVTMVLNAKSKDADGNLLDPDFDNILPQLIDIERRQLSLPIESTKAFKSGSYWRNLSNTRKSDSGADCSYCKAPHHMEDNCWLKYPKKANNNKFWDYNKGLIEDLKKKHSWEKANTAKENNDDDESLPPSRKKGSYITQTATAVVVHHQDSTWYMDSSALYHMTFSKKDFVTPLSSTSKTVFLADGTKVAASGVGKVVLKILIEGEDWEIHLPEVYYIPELDSNLISLGVLERKGLTWTGSKGNLQVYNKNYLILEASWVNTLYILDQTPTLQILSVQKHFKDLNIWHQQLGHLNERDVWRLSAISTGMKNLSGQLGYYEPCVLGKQHRQPNYNPGTWAAAPFGRVHTDLGGRGNTLQWSNGGNAYYIVFTEDYTRFCWWEPLQKKSQAFSKLQAFNVMAKNQFGKAIRKLWSGNGGEFNSQEAKSWMQEEGIQWELSVAYTPEQNGVSERSNRTLLEKACTQLIQVCLPATLWGESLYTAVYLANQSTTALLKTTPFETLYGTKPDLENLRVFGCDPYVHDPYAKSHRKMAPRAWKGRLVSYSTGSN